MSMMASQQLSSSSSLPQKKKKKVERTRLTLADLQKIIKYYQNENGKPAGAVSKFCSMGLKLRKAQQLFKEKDKWSDILDSDKNSSSKIVNQCLKLPVLEKVLLKYVSALREGGMSVSKSSIQAKALIISHQLQEKGHPDLQTYEREYLPNFTAASSFVQNFVRRNGLKSVYLHGKGGTKLDTEKVAKELDDLKTKMQQYTPETIFNTDETGLFYRLLPRRTYIIRSKENKRNVRGTKAMKAKDRLTAIVCTNSIGVKVPLACIGKSKSPRVFRTVETLPIAYFSQKKAWSTGKIFKKWFNEIFLPFVRRMYPGQKILLLMDHCGSHNQEDLFFDSFGQVDVDFLPKNTTALYQPMDAGIIACMKCNYRYGLLHETLKWVSIDMGDDNALFDKIQRRPLPKAGYRGIEDGYPANILEAMQLLKTAWDAVSETTVVRCWLKTTILPEAFSSPLVTKYGKKKIQPVLPIEQADEFATIVKDVPDEKLDLLLPSVADAVKDMKLIFQDAVSTRNAFDEFIKIEDDPDVQLVLENELLDEIDDISTMTLTVEDTSEKSLPSEKIPVRNYQNMVKHFDQLIDLGSNDFVLSSKLRNLRLKFVDNHKPKQTQLRISVMFGSKKRSAPDENDHTCNINNDKDENDEILMVNKQSPPVVTLPDLVQRRSSRIRRPSQMHGGNDNYNWD